MFLDQIESFLTGIQDFLIGYWPYLIVLGIIYIALEEGGHLWWHIYIHNKKHNWVHHQGQVLLQIRFPKENLKTPKAMEQVLASLHGTYSFGIPWRDEIIKGKVEDWLSLEMVGKSDGIRFYAQVMEGNRKMFEAAFFAQYPEVEIVEVEDYLNDLPDILPNETYDLYGTEYILRAPEGDAMPIKTYQHFESPSDEQRLDPMATIAEAVSNLKEDETILLQLVLRPAGEATHPHVYESKRKIIGRIMNRQEKKTHAPGVMGLFGGFAKNILMAPFKHPDWTTGHAEEEEDRFSRFVMTTPIEQEILKAVENKISKNLFETIFRFIYIDRKDSFTGHNVSAIFGAVTQFSERNMNSFGPASGSFTIVQKLKYISASYKWFFKKTRLVGRKKLLFKAYKERSFPVGEPLIEGDYHTESSVLSVEELATIFHPPGAPIGAQKLAPIEMKKAGPPSSLPIVPE